MVSAPLPEALLQFLSHVAEGSVDRLEQLKGGAISQTVRVVMQTGETYVAKFCAQAPGDLYEIEADGLHALRHKGCPRVPDVISVGADFLLLEDLGQSEKKAPSYWEDLGRQVAALHQHRHHLFGYHLDNYLGLAVQKNSWHTDGHEFYVNNRILRYLDEGQSPLVLTAEDRCAIEFFCVKLRDRVPVQQPSLCHGDLWVGNLVVTSDGSPAYVDPAVFYGWPEADLGMTIQYDSFGERFYDAYVERNPLQPGWRDRLEIYHIKEWLSMVAHFGETRRSLSRLREFLNKYS